MKNKIKITDLPNVLVSAGLLVDQQGRVLIAQRPEGKSMAGLWEFPGGKVHPEESEAAALVRELKEELDLTIAPENLKKVMDVSYDYDDFHLEMPLFLCRTWQGDITPLEGQEVAWVAPEDLKNYPMPPADLPILDQIAKILERLPD